VAKKITVTRVLAQWIEGVDGGTLPVRVLRTDELDANGFPKVDGDVSVWTEVFVRNRWVQSDDDESYLTALMMLTDIGRREVSGG
jgi:hypothetical protein